MALRHHMANTESDELLNWKTSSRLLKGGYGTDNENRFSGIRITHSEPHTSSSMPGAKVKPPSYLLKSKLHTADGKAEEFFGGPAIEDTMDRENENHGSRAADGDVLLLQWGQRKRQRNGRIDIRLAGAEVSITLSEKSSKIVVDSTVTEKQDRSPPAPRVRSNRGHIQRASHTAPRETTCATRLRDVDAYSPTKDAYFSTPSSCNGLNVSDEKVKTRRLPPSPEKLDLVVNCIRPASGSSLGINAQGCTDTEFNQVQAPVLEKIDWDSLELPEIVISLSRKEKEEDFLAIKGSKLPQRPKKRPKQAEKALQFVSPGMWLPDLTKERYEVREKKTVKKKPRGLKAMGSIDSESE